MLYTQQIRGRGAGNGIISTLHSPLSPSPGSAGSITLMLADYLGVLALIVVAAAIAVVFVGGSWLLGPKKRTPYKQSAYECGVQPVGDAHERFPIKFYLVG